MLPEAVSYPLLRSPSAPLHQLQPIPERIIHVHPIEARQRDGGLDGVTGGFAAGDEGSEVADDERGMGHACRVEFRFDAEVEHHRAGAEPATTATAERLGT